MATRKTVQSVARKSTNSKKKKKAKTKKSSPDSALPPEVKAMQKLTRQELQALILSYAWLPVEDVRKQVRNKNAMMIDALIAKSMELALDTGCVTRLNFLLDKLGVGNINIDYGKEARDDGLIAAKTAVEAPMYVVEVGENGKFSRARPRIAGTIDVDVEASEVH